MKINQLVKEFEAHAAALVNVLVKMKDASPEDKGRFVKKVEPIMTRFNDELEKNWRNGKTIK